MSQRARCRVGFKGSNINNTKRQCHNVEKQLAVFQNTVNTFNLKPEMAVQCKATYFYLPGSIIHILGM